MGWPYPWDRNINPLVIPPGYCRHQVAIQLRSSDQDDNGQPLESWNTVLTTMAGIVTVLQREAYQTGQSAAFVAQVTHRVTIHYPGDSVSLFGGMRVMFGLRRFDVQTVENVQERNRVIHLMCLEVNGGATCS